MERIIINGLLYKCKDGTNAKIKEALKNGGNAPRSAHEDGTAHDQFNDLLWKIIDSKKGEYIENVYQTN